MIPADRRLIALMATLCPGRAPALLGRLSGEQAGELATEGSSLAAAPRRARLVALALALSCEGPSASVGGARHPLLARLTLEAEVRSEPEPAPRTAVRPANLRGAAGP